MSKLSEWEQDNAQDKPQQPLNSLNNAWEPRAGFTPHHGFLPQGQMDAPACTFGVQKWPHVHVFIPANVFQSPLPGTWCRQQSYFDNFWRHGGHGWVVFMACEPLGPGKGVSSVCCLLYHAELLRRFEIGVITNVQAWEKVLRSDPTGGIMAFSQDCLFPTGACR